MRAYQPGAATSIEVTGQSGQSELHTVGEHRPGGPTTAEPDDSYCLDSSALNILS